MGLAAGVICALAVGLKYRWGYDDSLDVVGVHLVGGLVGTLGIGLLATASAPTAVDGLFYGGGVDQLGKQLLGAIAVFAYAFLVSGVIAWLVHRGMGFRDRRGARGQRDRPGDPRGDGVRPALDRRRPHQRLVQRAEGHRGAVRATGTPVTERLGT